MYRLRDMVVDDKMCEPGACFLLHSVPSLSQKTQSTDHQPQVRPVIDPPALLDLPGDPFQQLLAVAADHGAMTHHPLGAGSLHQTTASIRLPAPPRLLARAALFRQLPFEFSDPLKCLASLLQRFCSLFSQGRVLCFQLSDLLLCCHGFTVVALAIPPKLLHT